MMIRLLAALLVATALAGPHPAAADPQTDDISVVTTEHGREARVAVNGCEAALVYRPDQAGMHYRDACKQPLPEKLSLLARLMGALLDETAGQPERLTVFVGRIAQTFPDLAAELVTAAADTSAWDPELARRSSAAANAIVVQILARTEGGAAIRSAALPGGYRVTGIAVEKVLTALPRQLPFPLPPRVVGGNSDTPLPFDALLWIGVAR